MFLWFHKLGSPPHFYRIAGKWIPWLSWIFILLLAAGLYGGLVLAPPDSENLLLDAIAFNVDLKQWPDESAREVDLEKGELRGEFGGPAVGSDGLVGTAMLARSHNLGFELTLETAAVGDSGKRVGFR